MIFAVYDVHGVGDDSFRIWSPSNLGSVGYGGDGFDCSSFSRTYGPVFSCTHPSSELSALGWDALESDLASRRHITGADGVEPAVENLFLSHSPMGDDKLHASHWRLKYDFFLLSCCFW